MKFTERKYWVFFLYSNYYSCLEKNEKREYLGVKYCLHPFRVKLHKITKELSKGSEYHGYCCESYNKIEEIPIEARLKNLKNLQ